MRCRCTNQKRSRAKIGVIDKILNESCLGCKGKQRRLKMLWIISCMTVGDSREVDKSRKYETDGKNSRRREAWASGGDGRYE